MRLIYILGVLIVVYLTSCNGQIKPSNDKDCETYYVQAKNKLNEYYLVNEDSSLYSSLNYTEKALSSCPEFKDRLTDLKITLLMLLHEYNAGYEFVNTLTVKNFTKPYKKNLYLKTFKALSLEVQGDTFGKDSCFNELEKEIGTYVSKYPSDKDAIVDLFLTKAKHINTEVVIEEIELLQEKNKEDNEFFEGLKETIRVMPN
jgi:hypothetical protein